MKHTICVKALRSVSLPLLMTWPCFTEAVYLLGRNAGWRGQEQLWSMLTSGHLHLHSFGDDEVNRMQALMARYRNVPMDLAEASLVAAAETLRTKGICTSDGGFRTYRLNDEEPFELLL